MMAFKRISLLMLSVGFFALAAPGCKTRDESEPTGTAEVPPEKLAEVRSRYGAVEGYLVGDVEAADQTYAAVSGIDPKLINEQSIFSFVDASDGEIVATGRMQTHTATGRIFVRHDPGKRQPKAGDLAAVKKATP